MLRRTILASRPADRCLKATGPETRPDSAIPVCSFVRFVGFVVETSDPCFIRVSSVAQEILLFTSFDIYRFEPWLTTRVSAAGGAAWDSPRSSAPAIRYPPPKAVVRGSAFARSARSIVTLPLLRLAVKSPPGWPSRSPSIARPQVSPRNADLTCNCWRPPRRTSLFTPGVWIGWGSRIPRDGTGAALSR